MKQRHVLLVAILVLAIAVFYHVADHIKWLNNYIEETGHSWSSEIMPLIFSLLFLLPVLFMFLLWTSKKTITSAYLWMMVIGSGIMAFAILGSRQSEDALSSGIMLLVIGLPISIVLSILAGMEWKK